MKPPRLAVVIGMAAVASRKTNTLGPADPMPDFAIIVAAPHNVAAVSTPTGAGTIAGAHADCGGTAAALAAAVIASGVAAEHCAVVAGAAATRTAIESAVRRAAFGAVAGDRILYFHVGCGFESGGRNFVVCADLHGAMGVEPRAPSADLRTADLRTADLPTAELARASIDLAWIVGEFGASKSRSVVLFFDLETHHSPTEALIDGTASPSAFDDAELERTIARAANTTCLVARRSGEVVQRPSQLGQSHWTQHLIDAFKGRSPGAFDVRGRLTAHSLQRHLEAAPTLASSNMDDEHTHQTPWLCSGARADVVLSNAERDRRAEKTSHGEPGVSGLREIVLVGSAFGAIKTLSGFRKGQQIRSSDSSRYADAFVARLAEAELKEDLEVQSAALRRVYRFKRKDLTAFGPDEGAASIRTPYFDYDVRIGVDPDDATRYRMTRRVSNVRAPERVLSTDFTDVFEDTLHALEFHTRGAIDLADVVDAIEERDDHGLTVEYDTALTHCVVRLTGSVVVAEFQPQLVRVGAQGACELSALLAGHLRLREVLGEVLDFDARTATG